MRDVARCLAPRWVLGWRTAMAGAAAGARAAAQPWLHLLTLVDNGRPKVGLVRLKIYRMNQLITNRPRHLEDRKCPKQPSPSRRRRRLGSSEDLVAVGLGLGVFLPGVGFTLAGAADALGWLVTT